MKTYSAYRYFRFGAAFRYLLDANPGYDIHNQECILSSIHRILSALNVLDLQVTTRAATDLIELEKEFAKTPKDTKLSGAQATKLRETMKSLRNTLEAELQGVVLYQLITRRIDVNKLLRVYL